MVGPRPREEQRRAWAPPRVQQGAEKRLVLSPHPRGPRRPFLLPKGPVHSVHGRLQSAFTHRLRAPLSLPQALAARQQARRLRWARPPPPAQLRVTRERMRREVRTRAALRWVQGFPSQHLEWGAHVGCPKASTARPGHGVPGNGAAVRRVGRPW